MATHHHVRSFPRKRESAEKTGFQLLRGQAGLFGVTRGLVPVPAPLHSWHILGLSNLQRGRANEGRWKTHFMADFGGSPIFDGRIGANLQHRRRSVLLILDASGSMNAKLPNGETRIAVAQRATKGVAGFIPAQAQLSLRMYGAQSPARQKNCQDTHLAVPFGAASANADAITQQCGESAGLHADRLSLNRRRTIFPPTRRNASSFW